jgi:pimeloyl-ACP methyl ester carboxylesterase
LQAFTSFDGTRVAYRDEGAGRPLLLIHGLMAHSGFFAWQRPLADHFRLIAIDLRGQGMTGGGSDAPTMANLAGDVEALVSHLDLHDAIGVGWSLGAQVLWHVLAGSTSPRFAGAVAIDMTPRVRNDPSWQLGLSAETCEARRAAIEADFPAFAAAAGQAIFAQPVADSIQRTADWASGEFARNDPAAVAALWDSLVAQDLRASLPDIRQPTLIVHGAQSHLYGSDTADYLVATLPNARAIQFDRSGHSPHIEEPDLFNQALRDFAASLPRVREVHASL